VLPARDDAKQLPEAEAAAFRAPSTESEDGVLGVRERLRVAARFIFVADGVHDAAGLRVGWAPRAVLQLRAHVLAVPRAGEALDPRVADRAEHGGERFTRLVARPLLSESLRGALVSTHVKEVGVDLELVERTLQVDDLPPDPDGVDVARGADPNLRAAPRQEE